MSTQTNARPRKHSLLAERLAIDALARGGLDADVAVGHAAVYGLTDATGAIRYVGCTAIGLLGRLIRHFDWARTTRTFAIDEWLRAARFVVGVRILELDPSDPRAAELAWIHRLRDEGCDLVNYIGGPAREEHRAAIGAANRRRFARPGEGEKIAAANRRRVVTAETREKLRANALGRRHSPESRAKMSAQRKGKPKSAETRARMSDAQKKRFAKGVV